MDFEHNFAIMWNECNCMVVCTFFGICQMGLEWELTFLCPVAIAEFSKFADIRSAALQQQNY